MNDRKNRLGELTRIPYIARIDHRHFLDKSGDLAWKKNLTRKQRRTLEADSKKLAEKYKTVLKKLFSSGVGFPVDQTLRQMAIEYTHRFASSGTETLPVSFNYFEAFCNIKLIKDSVAPYAMPLEETNHLFQASDFLDFFTSEDCQNSDIANLLRLRENHVFHFTNNGNIEEITFFDASGREYVLSGFSVVRRGTSLHWFLVAGEKLTEEEWEVRRSESHDIDISNITPWKRAFLKEAMDRTGTTAGPPLRLEGTEYAVRTLVAGEFDLLQEKHIGRCIFVETENSFAVFSDDPEILVGFRSNEHKKGIIDTALDRIGQADILWSLAEGLFNLPQYFEARVTLSKSLIRDRGQQLGLKGKGGRGLRADYVAVEAISVEDQEAPSTIRRISMPGYAIETEGHWRRLNFAQIGKDREGNPVAGKTWVNRSSPWRDERNRDRVVFVKDLIAVAKAKVQDLYSVAERVEAVNHQAHKGNGELYVLRCALMEEEVFKVGWTSVTAQERAQQLSSATGVPLAFVVVESWVHNDPEALETEVHAQLSPYRVNNQREFFRLNFTEIRRIIVTTMERVKDSGMSV
jgi:hypothetical protein